MNIGILGTGSIARTMAAEFAKVPAFRCEAVCSRQQTTGEALAQQFGIEALLSRRFKYLSTGETRKTLLCQALMNQPDLLILDEPFDGLDVASRASLTDTLRGLQQPTFTLVLVLFAGLRERLTLASVPDAFAGAPIGFIAAGLLSLAFMGFVGLPTR